MALESTGRPAECTDWLLKSKKADLSPLSSVTFYGPLFMCLISHPSDPHTGHTMVLLNSNAVSFVEQVSFPEQQCGCFLLVEI